MALFDVLMPVKNGQSHLEIAIRSVQAQSVKDWRLLVLDHGSSDGTHEIVAKLAKDDRRIEMFNFSEAKGLSGLLNEGLERVQAPYTMRMDADDECLPQRMAITAAAFTKQPRIVLIGGQAEAIDENGRGFGPLRNPCDPDALARTSLFHNPFIHPSVSLRTQAVMDSTLRYGRSMFRHQDAAATIEVPSLAEDYLMFGELAMEGLALNVPDTVLRYRFHDGSISRQKYHDQLRVAAQISRHFAGVLCRRHGVTLFDPVPFCSHGQSLINVGDSQNYSHDYQLMCAALQNAGPAWQTDRAELAWRKTYVKRSSAHLLIGAAKGALFGNPGEWELKTVANTLRQRFRGVPSVQIEAAA